MIKEVREKSKQIIDEITGETKTVYPGDLVGYIYNGMHIPIDTKNRYYQKIQKLIQEGVKVIPAWTDEELEQLIEQEKQNEFRTNRDKELQLVDIAINKAIDNNATSEEILVLRQYRQALRDATKDWVMPDKPTSKYLG